MNSSVRVTTYGRREDFNNKVGNSKRPTTHEFNQAPAAFAAQGLTRIVMTRMRIASILIQCGTFVGVTMKLIMDDR